MSTDSNYNENLLHALMNTMQESVLLVDAQGNVQRANLMAEQLFNRSLSEIVDANVQDLFEAPDTEIVLRALRSGETLEGVLPIDKSYTGAIRRRRGGAYPVNYTIGSVEAHDSGLYVLCIREVRDRIESEDKSNFIAEVIDDIANRQVAAAMEAQAEMRNKSDALRKAETALSEQEAEVRAQYAELSHLYEAAPAALLYVDANLTISRINGYMASLLEVEHESALGTSLRDAQTNASRILVPFFERVLLHGRAIEQTEVALPAGVAGETETTWVANFVPIQSDGGALQGILSSLGDITAWKHAEAAYRRSEERFRRLTEASFEGVVIHRDGTILECNEAFASMFGIRPRQTAVGQALAEILPTKEARPEFERFLLAYREGRFETRARSKSGGEFAVEMEARLIDHEDGPASVLGVRDISERVRIEQHRRQLQRLEALATLAGGIAHDFNNVLAGAIGYAELAQREIAEGSRVSDDIGEVLRALARARGLVRQLLAFSSGSRAGATSLNMADTIPKAMAALENDTPQNVDVVVDSDHPCGPVNADREQIQLAVTHLCTNAFQAMRETGGTLTVSLREVSVSRDAQLFGRDMEPGRYARIRFHDTGLGMSSETMERMYEPFFSAEGLAESSGLGLATVYGIVRLYGGAIAAESTPGEGTQIDMYFPVSDDVAIKPVEEKTQIGKALVVDDEPALTQVMGEALRRCGYEPVEFSDPEAALHAFADDAQSYRFVITDLTMPGMDGMELVEAIRRVDRDIPIVVVTGYSALLNPDHAAAVGVSEILPKPFRLPELVAIVKRVGSSESQSQDA